MNLEIITNSSEETEKVGYAFAKSLKDKAIITLTGDLGAGKTVFVKGLAKGLKISDTITSPTFTIMNEYLEGEMPLYHFDMYRLENEGEAEELGFNEYFSLSSLNGIAVIEWPERIKTLLKDKHIQIDIKKIDDEKRKITIGESLC